ncbi:hypothetical protein [Acidaminobacter hydrogenoformans]|uniref:Uncharacterized protein n=1 Tax=Acidaminobacter hydrogenoformans DSM 2784 TaxID=1120920 RepID=A0A1G5S8Q9_9FIRM|nr:hypothetical protein [Acidaminobacter hydrogenoformans]SCZ82091.1 hypothetical protein SAMN03080599_03348 [Acidaminobacter hydrogenoformans DSM 2784]
MAKKPNFNMKSDDVLQKELARKEARVNDLEKELEAVRAKIGAELERYAALDDNARDKAFSSFEALKIQEVRIMEKLEVLNTAGQNTVSMAANGVLKEFERVRAEYSEAVSEHMARKDKLEAEFEKAMEGLEAERTELKMQYEAAGHITMAACSHIDGAEDDKSIKRNYYGALIRRA